MSIDTCKLFAKASTSNNTVNSDRSGTVRSMCVHIEQLYRLVFTHVKDCETCDPNEVLQTYLDSRVKARKPTLVSKTLLKIVDRYAKLPGVDQSLVKKFYLMQNSVETMMKSPMLSPQERVEAIHNLFIVESFDRYMNEPLKVHAQSIKKYPLFAVCAELFDRNRVIDPTDEEIYRLADVYETLRVLSLSHPVN